MRSSSTRCGGWWRQAGRRHVEAHANGPNSVAYSLCEFDRQKANEAIERIGKLNYSEQHSFTAWDLKKVGQTPARNRMQNSLITCRKLRKVSEGPATTVYDIWFENPDGIFAAINLFFLQQKKK